MYPSNLVDEHRKKQIHALHGLRSGALFSKDPPPVILGAITSSLGGAK